MGARRTAFHAESRWTGTRARRVIQAAVVTVLATTACSGSAGNVGGAPTGPIGQSCSQASQCFPGLDAGALEGEVTCLTQLQNGYCTQTCQSDASCCSVPGACIAGFSDVCASFESSGQMYCFLSCDASDIAAAPDAGTTDPDTFCQRWANASFSCRSTGGGSTNRKFCGP